ncbi:hypothetical protein [Parasitella parasitica]|uniref:Vacuolar-sorting protein SNF7 n=1 Tax=Parasitella parasitica TaxID=35722 RepID=A0A0B7N3L0_9FUNG|nr:hypothetical protein [Parasitella parasitica]
MNLFFGKAKQKTTPKDAIVKLRDTSDMLDKRRIFLETRADNELVKAKQNATKNKKAALLALKKRKALEVHIENIHNAQMNIENQIMALENANVNMETFNAMRIGADALKITHGKMDIDKVDATMDDLREQMDLNTEISEAISRPVKEGEEFDEDELLEELEHLEQEELDAKMLETPSPVSSAPKVPPHKPVGNKINSEESDEEAELRALQATMAS